MDRLHKGDRIRLTERRHIGDNQYAPAGTTGTVLTGGRFTAQVALDGLRDPYFDRAAQVAVTPNVGQGNSGYEINTPAAALARASARALSQPGAKWTPATGWTDEPIAPPAILPHPMPGDMIGAQRVIASVQYRDEPTLIATVLLLNPASPFFTVAHYFMEDAPAEDEAPFNAAGTLHELATELNIVPAVREYEQAGGDY